MKKFELVPFVIASVLLIGQAHAETWVWLLYGLGGQWTSGGVDQIAARARNIPGVTKVTVLNYTDTQRVYDEVMAAPAGVRVVIGGYSCGANAAEVISLALWQSYRQFATIANIQASKWCGGNSLEGLSPHYAQSTYNASCWETFGLGCKPLEPAPSFQGHIININRPDSHGDAQYDPDTQADVLKAIAATSLYGHPRPPARPPGVTHPIPPVVAHPIEPPAAAPPIGAGIDCRWAWSSNRGWAVICSRPDRRVHNIVRMRGQ
jgi:hypothetical protein